MHFMLPCVKRWITYDKSNIETRFRSFNLTCEISLRISACLARLLSILVRKSDSCHSLYELDLRRERLVVLKLRKLGIMLFETQVSEKSRSRVFFCNLKSNFSSLRSNDNTPALYLCRTTSATDLLFGKRHLMMNKNTSANIFTRFAI